MYIKRRDVLLTFLLTAKTLWKIAKRTLLGNISSPKDAEDVQQKVKMERYYY